MNKYGFDEIAVRTNDEEEVVQVEQLILEEMMTSTIEENAKKLSKVVSSRSVTLYKKMAVFFMTTPNASMTSAVHGRYQQYQELLAKL